MAAEAPAAVERAMQDAQSSASGAPSAGDEVESCSRCKLPLTKNQSERGSQTWCSYCANNYSSLQKRWKKNKALKTWYQDKNDRAKTEYFAERRKEQETVSGKKRSFDEVNVENTDRKSAYRDVGDIEKFQTFRMWAIGEKTLYPELSMKQLQDKWNLELQKPDAEVMERAGETLLKVFAGVEVNTGTSERREVTVKRAKKNVQHEDDLVETLVGAQDNLAAVVEGRLRQAKPSGSKPENEVAPAQRQAALVSPRMKTKASSMMELPARREVNDMAIERMMDVSLDYQDARVAMLHEKSKKEEEKAAGGGGTLHNLKMQILGAKAKAASVGLARHLIPSFDGAL